MGQLKRKANNRQVRNGLGGNLDTVSIMRQIARARGSDLPVREFALMILREYNVASHNYAAEAMAIGDYVKRMVVYRRDIEGVEQLQDPLLMIQDIQTGRAAGDCDDMSLLIATLLISIGCAPYFRTVRYSGKSGPYNHIYVVVYDRNGKEKAKRIVLDAIIKDKPIGFEIAHTSGAEYAV